MTDEQVNTNGELWYPRRGGDPDFILVSLYDVRAADDLVVSYDFDRDGWSISRLEQHDVELSFIPAWDDKT